ncbi:hypothetical protein Q088_00677 [Pseudomonas aeruginosa C41]|uniref:hypothetical protein n=1 Tax=Pseudomonas aeruginosa TaxID=287 RepID=UPI0003B9D12F|nr:hypothetical protein [Pseudomonas aeruginosa]ERU69764.1 hypothetical protein Q088_00677 [Pseudomonas aeruginosa C41]
MSGVVAVQVCTAWTSTPEGYKAFREVAWQQTYLLPPEAAGYVDILVNGGFDPSAFRLGAAGVLGSFVTGLLIGWVASLLRKAK